MDTSKGIFDSAAQYACYDITKYLKETNQVISTGTGKGVDVWIATGWHIYTKENRRLNKQLGIRYINYNGGKSRY